jgi:hypothetical protein
VKDTVLSLVEQCRQYQKQALLSADDGDLLATSLSKVDDLEAQLSVGDGVYWLFGPSSPGSLILQF